MNARSLIKRCITTGCVLLVGLVLIPLGGCMNMGLFGSTKRAELSEEECHEVKEDILNHLEEKYGIFFSGSSLFASYVDEQSIKFWRPSASDKEGVAYRETEGTCFRRVSSDGTVTYSDDFAYNLFEPLYQERVEALAKEIVTLPDYALKVKFSPWGPDEGALPENIRSLDDIEAFENLLHGGDPLTTPELYVQCFVPQSDVSSIDFDVLTRFEQRLKELASKGYLKVNGLDPEYYAKDHFNDSGERWFRTIRWGWPEDADLNTGPENDVWNDVVQYSNKHSAE